MAVPYRRCDRGLAHTKTVLSVEFGLPVRQNFRSLKTALTRLTTLLGKPCFAVSVYTEKLVRFFFCGRAK